MIDSFLNDRIDDEVEALNEGLKITYSDIFSNPTIRMLSENKNKKRSRASDFFLFGITLHKHQLLTLLQ